jgi:hypothetical protein
MQIQKLAIFVIALVLCVITLFAYAEWSYSRFFVYLAGATVFSIVAYFFYKSMFTDDE